MRRYMTPGDVILLTATLVLTATLFFFMPRWVLSTGRDIEIVAHDKVVGRYPLNVDRTIPVAGPLGTTIVGIKHGKVRIVSSPCPNEVCVHMGEFGTEGGVLVCVPNEVVVRVGKELPDGLDAVSR